MLIRPMPWDFKHKGYINPYEHGLMIIPPIWENNPCFVQRCIEGIAMIAIPKKLTLFSLENWKKIEEKSSNES